MDIANETLIEIGRRVLRLEGQAVTALADALGNSFAEACRLILACQGRVIITGMGKSGHIGQKLAASLTSTGTAAHFLHPAEGVHGDLGVIHRNDLLLAISNSGETAEILGLLGPVHYLEVPLIAVTQRADSTLGKAAQVALELGDLAEADSNNLVPTTTTTATLALGDALTVALMEARGFTPEDFAIFHPQGMLGKRLTLKVADLLRGAETNPVIQLAGSFGTALETMTEYKLGGVCVVEDGGQLAGIITDGDVRRIFLRALAAGDKLADIVKRPVADVMTVEPSRISQDALAYDALKLMENHQPRPIFLLPVVDSLGEPVGLLHLHALVQAGFKSDKLGEAN